jgi:hypothetical protein
VAAIAASLKQDGGGDKAKLVLALGAETNGRVDVDCADGYIYVRARS